MKTEATALRLNSPLHSFNSPFWILVKKEMADVIVSWRFRTLIVLVLLIFSSSLIHVSQQIPLLIQSDNFLDKQFLFLKIFTSSGATPSYYVLISFVAPLLGISLGFDSINSEMNNRTLTRIMAQPLFRDNILSAKFFAPIIILTILFLSLTGLVVAAGMLYTGMNLGLQEAVRILAFVVLLLIYIAFWLAFSMLMSIVFKQSATAALTALALWLFLTIFYPMVVELIMQQLFAGSVPTNMDFQIRRQQIMMDLLKISPSQLFLDGSSTLLMPTIRSLGPLNTEDLDLAIPNPLPLRDSILMVWSQWTGLLAGTMLCFALSYYVFMRKEIRI